MSAHGFSLLEVLAALALLAILLLGVYSGVRSTTMSVERGSAAVARLDELRGAREFLRREVAGATALPWKLDTHGTPVAFEGDNHGFSLVSMLPGYLGKLGPQVIRIGHGDDPEVRTGEAGSLSAALAPLPTSHDAMRYGEPERLVTHVRDVTVRYAKRGSVEWRDRWDDPMEFPAMIEVRIEPEEGASAWPPLVLVPRQGPTAVNVRAAASSLQQAGTP